MSLVNSFVSAFRSEMGWKLAGEFEDLPGLGIVIIIDSKNSEEHEPRSAIWFREVER